MQTALCIHAFEHLPTLASNATSLHPPVCLSISFSHAIRLAATRSRWIKRKGVRGQGRQAGQAGQARRREAQAEALQVAVALELP